MNQAYDYPQGFLSLLDRDQLIKAHLGLVDFLVERMVMHVPQYMTRDDISSAATLGLIDAARRFDPGKGVLFKTFAEQRIRGAIIDEARKMDSFSRTLREKQARIEKAVIGLGRRLGRDPDEQEVAGAMGCTLEQYRLQLQEVSHLGLISLNKRADPEGTERELQETIEDKSYKSPPDQLEAKSLVQEIARHLGTLPEKERQVISLFYFEELSQKEIAQVMGLTEGRISQLHSQALIKLRVKLRNQRD
ncbi:MAG: FliA/WhiG family RNA polymerase sigma factor [Desulfobulbaceae bacterium]|nr:FliA/WhiG family RNA polymerase sigma factor [Desulfobulbaceae bacterium]